MLKSQYSRSIKGLLCFALLFVLILPLFAACNSNSDTDIIPQNESNLDDTENTPNAGDAEFTYKYPDVNYDGYNFRILNLDDDNIYWAITTMVVEEENADVINDAIYQRNILVEDNLGITISQIYKEPSSIETEIKKSIASGSDDYDIAFSMYDHSGNIATAGYYLNLYDIDSLDLTQPWWDQNANETFELSGKLYFTATDANVMTSDSLWVLYFNKKLVRDLDLDDPYQLVKDGKWTMDAMLKMMSEAIGDLDGDGQFTGGDRWGLSSHSFATGAFLRCGDTDIIKKDSQGTPYLVSIDERFANVYTKVREFLDKTNGMFLDAQGTYKGQTEDTNHPSKTFLNNMSLFCTECLSWTRSFREMESDFGILPHPKYDENQSAYYTLMNDTPTFGVLTTNADPNRTGVILDAMTAVSSTTIIPAYYDVALNGKYFRDEESIEMLDIIRANRLYDLSSAYSWADFFLGFIDYAFVTKGDNPAAYFEKNSSKVDAAIQKTLQKFAQDE